MELVVRLKKIVAGMLFIVLLMGNSVYAQENAYTVKLPDSCRTPLCYDSKNPGKYYNYKTITYGSNITIEWSHPSGQCCR